MTSRLFKKQCPEFSVVTKDIPNCDSKLLEKKQWRIESLKETFQSEPKRNKFESYLLALFVTPKDCAFGPKI